MVKETPICHDYSQLQNILKQKSCEYMSMETNDCTVRALALATDSSYDFAHSFATQYFHRKPRKGLKQGQLTHSFGAIYRGIRFAFKTDKNINVRSVKELDKKPIPGNTAFLEDFKRVFGLVPIPVDASKDYKQPDGRMLSRKMKLATFAKTFTQGSYYLIVRGHAICVKDGKVMDSATYLNRPIAYAWKFEAAK